MDSILGRLEALEDRIRVVEENLAVFAKRLDTDIHAVAQVIGFPLPSDQPTPAMVEIPGGLGMTNRR